MANSCTIVGECPNNTSGSEFAAFPFCASDVDVLENFAAAHPDFMLSPLSSFLERHIAYGYFISFYRGLQDYSTVDWLGPMKNKLMDSIRSLKHMGFSGAWLDSLSSFMAEYAIIGEKISQICKSKNEVSLKIQDITTMINQTSTKASTLSNKMKETELEGERMKMKLAQDKNTLQEIIKEFEKAQTSLAQLQDQRWELDENFTQNMVTKAALLNKPLL